MRRRLVRFGHRKYLLRVTTMAQAASSPRLGRLQWRSGERAVKKFDAANADHPATLPPAGLRSASTETHPRFARFSATWPGSAFHEEIRIELPPSRRRSDRNVSGDPQDAADTRVLERTADLCVERSEANDAVW